jgi:hypothetical protein
MFYSRPGEASQQHAHHHEQCGGFHPAEEKLLGFRWAL